MNSSTPVAGVPREALLLLTARGVRAFADGLVSIVLPVYLLQLGYGPVETGVIATATLTGSALLTLAIGLFAHRTTNRPLLMAASLLMVGTGMAFAGVEDLWLLLLVSFVGTLNPSSGDVSAFLPLEQAELAHLSSSRNRTRLFAWFSFVGSMAAAFGALAAAVPGIAADATGMTLKGACQAVFLFYAAVGAAVLLLYSRLPKTGAGGGAQRRSPLRESRGTVFRLAALFSLDSFGGGFVVQSLLSLWLFERFGLSLALAGSIFFWTGVLSAFSYFAAVRISDRIGLVNTMVFTHLPANLCLVLVPFSSDLWVALALLFTRSALSQMDVPTRTSFVMSVVTPAERAAAASVTAVPRSLAAAASPALAGLLLAWSGFGWPLVAGGSIKIVYDLLLLAMFRQVAARDERP